MFKSRPDHAFYDSPLVVACLVSLARLAVGFVLSIAIGAAIGISMWRSLQVTFTALLVGLPILAVLALVTFLAPPAAVVTIPLKFIGSALMIAWDFLDYPLSARGTTVPWDAPPAKWNEALLAASGVFPRGATGVGAALSKVAG